MKVQTDMKHVVAEEEESQINVGLHKSIGLHNPVSNMNSLAHLQDLVIFTFISMMAQSRKFVCLNLACVKHVIM